MLIILYIQHVMNSVVVDVEQVLHYICEYFLPFKYITTTTLWAGLRN